MTAETLGEPINKTISIAPDNTHTAVMRLITYGLIFFLTFQFCRNKDKAETTLKWIATAGVLYATYGLIIHWGGFNTILWFERTAYTTDVTSTFINRNSYATYAGLGLLSLITLFLKNSTKNTGSHQSHSIGKQKRIELFINNSWRPLLGMMLITTALITTHSRGGFISTAIAIGVLLTIFGIKKKLKTKTLLAATGGLLIIFLLAYSISSEILVKRLDRISLDAEGRFNVYELTTNAINDSPRTGFGYGVFRESFRLYRSEDVSGNWGKAHNTYIENSFELGYPASISLFLAITGATIIVFRGAMYRRRNWLYPATGVAVTILVAIHSLVDFSLQIPAVGIVFSSILGIAVAQSSSTKIHRQLDG